MSGIKLRSKQRTATLCKSRIFGTDIGEILYIKYRNLYLKNFIYKYAYADENLAKAYEWCKNQGFTHVKASWLPIEKL